MRESIGFSFVQRAHAKGHFHLRDKLKLSGAFRKFIMIRMFNFVLIVSLELKIRVL